MTASANKPASGNSALRQQLAGCVRDAGERSLTEVLDEIASRARHELGCGYAAISLIGPEGDLHRVPPAAEDAPARGVLDVPITVRGRRAATLRLADPRNNAFTVADERAAELIAFAAGTAVEKARTALENQRRERWYGGGSALAQQLVSCHHQRPLRLVADRTAEIAEADFVFVIHRASSDGALVLAAAAGDSAQTWEGFRLPVEGSICEEVMTSGQSVNFADHGDTDLRIERMRRELGIHAVLLVPMIGTRVRGLLGIGRRPGRKAFTSGELGTATMFASQVALGLELADSRAQRDHLVVLDERGRISRDLHDQVIQRLFAIGMSLQSVSDGLIGVAGQRVRAGIDDIDETIKEIRSTIHRLTGPIVAAQDSVRVRATQLIDDLELVLGFRPGLDLDGPIDFGVGDDFVEDCIAVLREALTNVARHANASRADVAITVTPARICLEIRDDGHGIGKVTRRSGLANLRARATRHGGALEIDSDESGTSVLWWIPLDNHQRGSSPSMVSVA